MDNFKKYLKEATNIGSTKYWKNFFKNSDDPEFEYQNALGEMTRLQDMIEKVIDQKASQSTNENRVEFLEYIKKRIFSTFDEMEDDLQ